MDTLTRGASIRDRVSGWRKAGARIALIPLLETLHKGHLSLVAEAQERAEHVIVSVFGDGATLQADKELLANIGAETLFIPPVQEIYPIGRGLAPLIRLPGLDDIFEGAAATRRFPEILTVILKLFNIVRPDIALFGDRDFQLLVMVRRLVDDLFLSIAVHGVATFRESDGLASASNNRDLTAEERVIAPQLHGMLADLASVIDAGDRNYAALEQRGFERLNTAGFAAEYVAIRQAADLGAVRAGARDLVILSAAALGRTRLADCVRVRLIDRY